MNLRLSANRADIAGQQFYARVPLKAMADQVLDKRG